MQIVLFGPPGAGKGTQGKRLSKLLGIPHIASGDIFREIREEDTPEAREVQRFMDAGQYVPDQLTIQIVLDRLARPDARRGFILDGFPRTEGQAEALDRALAAAGKRVDKVIYITAPMDVLVKRLTNRVICPQCGEIYNLETNPPKNDMICDVCGHKVEQRTDQAPDVVRTRLEVYERETTPLLEFYRKRGDLVEIDGSQPMAQVESEVDRALGLDAGRQSPFADARPGGADAAAVNT